MKKLIERFHQWRAEKRFKEGYLALNILLSKRDPRIMGMLSSAVERSVMLWLDQNRYNHCHKCPSANQLHRNGNTWMCDKHFKEAEKEIIKPTGEEILAVR
jgi:hypothetical protein